MWKSSHRYQRPNGYAVLRKASLLSDISRRLFGTECCLPRCERNLRRDNTKEFLITALMKYLNTQCTVLQHIPDYTSESNGTAETDIWSVMNMMRSILKGAGLSNNLWAESIIAACYIKSRFTSSNKLARGLESNLMCLDFESTDVLPLCMFPKKKEMLWTIDLKKSSSWIWIWKYL